MSRLEQYLRTYAESRGHIADKGIRYSVAFADLDGHGHQQAVVYLAGKSICGSGGCLTLIISPHDRSYDLITEIKITRLPIFMLPAESNGWHDIGVFVQEGGIQPGYEASLSFDGTSYPSNPTVPPARPLARNEGVLLLRPADKTEPLYR